MCGIIGYIGQKKCKDILLDCLKNLEYRGYDSSGIALVNNKNHKIIKCAGKIENLEKKIDKTKLIKSNLGIGHTRWATHGIANDINAHPHEGKSCIIVHNGIIENYQKLKEELINKGHHFYSDVDSEVIAKLLDDSNKDSNIDKLQQVCNLLDGSFALCVIFKNERDKIYFSKKDSPLVIGINNANKYICSDINSISEYCTEYVYIPEKSYGFVNKEEIKLYNFNKKQIFYNVENLEICNEKTDKKGYSHFMLKEIEEEPLMFENILKNNLERDILKINLEDYKGINKIIIIGCGSAMHAGLIAKNYLEKFAKIDVDVEIASEYRYKDLVLSKKTLAIFISQSGETADTLATLKMLKEKEIKTLSFVNVYNSSIAKLSDKVIYTLCGKEIAIASTKALIGQCLFLILFSIKLAYTRKKISYKKARNLTLSLYKIPNILKNIIEDKGIKNISEIINKNKKIMFIGRGIDYSLCLESSLKLKEITYIPSMCFQAGELKHGPISLIDDTTLVFVLNTNKTTLEKTYSNMQEVIARGGNIYCLSTYQNSSYLISDIEFANVFSSLTFFQLIAYYAALSKNLDIDKPRNLAKSVTVE